MRTFSLLLLWCAVACVSGGHAHAIVITCDYSAVVFDSQDTAIVPLGTIVTGSFSYDPTTPPTLDSGPSGTSVWDPIAPPSSIAINIPGVGDFSFGSAFVEQTLDSFSMFNAAQNNVQLFLSDVDSGSPFFPSNVLPSEFDLNVFTDNLSDQAFVVTNPDPPSVIAFRINAQLTSLNCQIIPEPTTLAIWSLLGGLGIIGWWRRRKH